MASRLDIPDGVWEEAVRMQDEADAAAGRPVPQRRVTVSVQALSKASGIGEQSVQRQCDLGILQHVRLGKRRAPVVPRHVVDALADRARPDPAAAAA